MVRFGAEERAGGQVRPSRGPEPASLAVRRGRWLGSGFSKEDSDNGKTHLLFPPPPEVKEHRGLGVSSVRPPRWGPSGTPKSTPRHVRRQSALGARMGHGQAAHQVRGNTPPAPRNVLL